MWLMEDLDVAGHSSAVQVGMNFETDMRLAECSQDCPTAGNTAIAAATSWENCVCQQKGPTPPASMSNSYKGGHTFDSSSAGRDHCSHHDAQDSHAGEIQQSVCRLVEACWTVDRSSYSAGEDTFRGLESRDATIFSESTTSTATASVERSLQFYNHQPRYIPFSVWNSHEYLLLPCGLVGMETVCWCGEVDEVRDLCLQLSCGHVMVVFACLEMANGDEGWVWVMAIVWATSPSLLENGALDAQVLFVQCPYIIDQTATSGGSMYLEGAAQARESVGGMACYRGRQVKVFVGGVYVGCRSLRLGAVEKVSCDAAALSPDI